MSGVRPYRSASLKRNRGRVFHSLKTYRLYEAGKDHRNNGVIGVARGAFGARGARGGGRGPSFTGNDNGEQFTGHSC